MTDGTTEMTRRAAQVTPPSRTRPSQLALAAVTALLGFLLATQFRSHVGLTTRLAGERESDLAQILSNLSTSTDQIQDELVDLRVRLASVRGSAEQEAVLADDARSRLESLRILLGLVPVHGQGIVVTIADRQGSVGPEILLDAVQELRDAGAEAIDIGGVRVVASTSFAGSAGALTVSGRPITSPYRVTVIGADHTLAEALRIPGGVVDTVTARSGATITIDERKDVSIASLHSAPRFTYATP